MFYYINYKQISSIMGEDPSYGFSWIKKCLRAVCGETQYNSEEVETIFA